MSTMQERIAGMRRDIATAKQSLANGGFRDLPAAIYVGHLERYEPGYSKSDKAQVYRIIRVTEGDEAGNTSRDWQSIENDVGMVICCQFLGQFGFEATPEDIFDLAASEAASKFVFHPDFIACCREIEQGQPKLRFQLTKRPGTDGGRAFSDVDILEVMEGLAETGAAPAPAVAPPQRAARSAPPAPPAPPADPEVSALIEFALRNGATINDAMDKAQIIAAIGEYEYPTVGVTEEQLLQSGYAKEDINMDSLISIVDADLLERNGLGSAVVRPAPIVPPAAPAAGGIRRRKK